MTRVMLYLFFFFFQAEDGIRDVAVTGVQTCALPISVYPSGACLATYSVAMLPPAPGRFSTMTGCPSTGCRRSAIRRASRSFEPPGGSDTMMRTGRAGQDAPCAQAQPAGRERVRVQMMNDRRVNMSCPLVSSVLCH